MTPLLAILIFVGVPVVLAAVIALAVFAPSWSRRSADAADLGDGPLFLTTDALRPDPSRLPREIGVESAIVVGGGAHGAW